ncbi:MAG: carbamoyl-phosphate synthase subunit L [Rhizobiales bacterium 32-66-11]|nr:MAG: carbamoyl-phosphate synthase subunit L [Rhizobiales bacterium 32-66-11]
MTTLLVTGVGAIIGYGILKSLRKAERNINLVGTDIYHDAVGQRWCDRFHTVPLTSDPKYLDAIRSIIVSERVDFIIPGIEQDCHFLSDNRSHFSQWAVCLNDRRLVDVSKDKWIFYQELQSAFPDLVIPSLDRGSFEELSDTLGLPFVVKPRRSYASKGLVVVRNAEAFAPLASGIGDRLIAQPFVGVDEEEYTIGAFGDGEGRCVASIVLQRRLAADGSTAKAVVRKDLDVGSILSRIFAHFKPVGPTNLQFRRDEQGLKLLEINPRISSSTTIRTAFGYNEAAMALDFFFRKKTIGQPEIRSGSAVRYIEDSIIYDRDHL